MVAIFYFPILIGFLIIPIDVHIFSGRGGEKPPTRKKWGFPYGVPSIPLGGPPEIPARFFPGGHEVVLPIHVQRPGGGGHGSY